MILCAISNLSIPENSNILDIGCGGGQAIKILACQNNVHKVFGLDYSITSINKSIKYNSDFINSKKVEIIQGNVLSMPFNAGQFNVITAFQTHYFWSDLISGLKEVNRVLKDKGIFILVAEEFKMKYHMQNHKSVLEYEELFKVCGFSKTSIQVKDKIMYAYAYK
jgi:ubiquinone/menaquinone biosynthesis C-methylase UbiE